MLESHNSIDGTSSPKTRVLLIGGGGLLGPELQRELIENHYEVFVTSRKSGPHIHKKATRIPGDFHDKEALSPAYWSGILQTHAIDVVINNAALTSSNEADSHKKKKDFSRVNWQGPSAIFEAAKACRLQQVIQVSSLAVMQRDQEKLSHSDYPRTKLRAEEELRRVLGAGAGKEGETQYTIVRPACIISPKKGCGGMPVFEMATLSDHYPVVGDKTINPVTVTDAASIITRCIKNEKAYGQTLAAAGPPTTWGKVFSNVRAKMGLTRGTQHKVSGFVGAITADTLQGLPPKIKNRISHLLPDHMDLKRINAEVVDISMNWRLPIPEEELRKMTDITGITPTNVWDQFQGQSFILPSATGSSSHQGDLPRR